MNKICPICSEPVPLDSLWVKLNVFYCSLECARKGKSI